MIHGYKTMCLGGLNVLEKFPLPLLWHATSSLEGGFSWDIEMVNVVAQFLLCFRIV